MKALRKNDIFPLEPYHSQRKSVFSVIVKHPHYVKRCVDLNTIYLSAEARESLQTFLTPPGTHRTRNTADRVEVSGRIVHCTLHAVLFENASGQAWIPSQFFDIDESRTTGPEETVAFVPQWVAVQKGLI